jgi:hypothetical protein
VLVEIDEYSLRLLQPHVGRWPWPRAVHSLLLDYLARAPAKLIAYDVNFAEPDRQRAFDFGDITLSGEASDKALVDSVRSAGNVIVLADATYDAIAGESDHAGRRFCPAAGLIERKVVPPRWLSRRGFGHNLYALDPMVDLPSSVHDAGPPSPWRPCALPRFAGRRAR